MDLLHQQNPPEQHRPILESLLYTTTTGRVICCVVRRVWCLWWHLQRGPASHGVVEFELTLYIFAEAIVRNVSYGLVYSPSPRNEFFPANIKVADMMSRYCTCMHLPQGEGVVIAP